MIVLGRSPSSLLRRWVLGSALGAGLALGFAAVAVLPAHAEAQSEGKPKRKAKTPKSGAKKSKGESAEVKPKKPYTAKRIIGLVKKGKSESEIADRAAAAGYVLSTADEKALKRAKVPASLIASLKSPDKARPGQAVEDFDDDAPTAKTAAKTAQFAAPEETAAPVPRTNPRPKTTLIPTEEAQPTDAPPRRKPLVASDG